MQTRLPAPLRVSRLSHYQCILLAPKPRCRRLGSWLPAVPPTWLLTRLGPRKIHGLDRQFPALLPSAKTQLQLRKRILHPQLQPSYSGNRALPPAHKFNPRKSNPRKFNPRKKKFTQTQKKRLKRHPQRTGPLPLQHRQNPQNPQNPPNPQPLGLSIHWFPHPQSVCPSAHPQIWPHRLVFQTFPQTNSQTPLTKAPLYLFLQKSVKLQPQSLSPRF